MTNMEHYDYQRVCQQVAQMQRWQITALNAAQAEKVWPVICHLATSPCRKLTRSCLDFVWASINSDAPITEALRLKTKITTTAEYRCEDYDTIQAFVASTLDFFVWALEHIGSDAEPKTNGEIVGLSHMISTAQQFDTAAESLSPIESTEMETAEMESQLRLMDILSEQTTFSNSLLKPLQSEAKLLARMFKERLPTLCFDHVADFVCRKDPQ